MPDGQPDQESDHEEIQPQVFTCSTWGPFRWGQQKVQDPCHRVVWDHIKQYDPYDEFWMDKYTDCGSVPFRLSATPIDPQKLRQQCQKYMVYRTNKLEEERARELCRKMKTNKQPLYISGLKRQGQDRHDECANLLLCFEESINTRTNTIKICVPNTGAGKFCQFTRYSVAYNPNGQINIASLLSSLNMCKENGSGRVYVYMEELMSKVREAFPDNRFVMVVEACRTHGQINGELEPYSPPDNPQSENNSAFPNPTGRSTNYVIVHVMCHGMQQGGRTYATGSKGTDSSNERHSERILKIVETSQQNYNRITTMFHTLYNQLQDEIRKQRTKLNITLAPPGPDTIEQAYVDATGTALNHTLFYNRLLSWKQHVAPPCGAVSRPRATGDGSARPDRRQARGGSREPTLQSVNAQDIKTVVMHFDSPLYFSLYSNNNTDVILCAKEGSRIVSGALSNWTINLLINDLLIPIRESSD